MKEELRTNIRYQSLFSQYIDAVLSALEQLLNPPKMLDTNTIVKDIVTDLSQVYDNISKRLEERFDESGTDHPEEIKEDGLGEL